MGISVVRVPDFFKKNFFFGNSFSVVFEVADHECDISFCIWGIYEAFYQVLPRMVKFLKIDFLCKNKFNTIKNEYDSTNFKAKNHFLIIAEKLIASF